MYDESHDATSHEDEKDERLNPPEADTGEGVDLH